MVVPSNSLLSRDFKYTVASQTDIRRLFARVRAEQAKQSQPKNVQPMRRKA